jgi:outer membrane lipoprotein-sorting protein
MTKITKCLFFTLFIASSSLLCAAQDINMLVLKAKQKIDKVNDYEAAARMKTNVTFLKVPIATVKVYFKKPNKLKVKSEKGISFIPKGAVSINMNSILENNDYIIMDAGKDKINNIPVRVARLLPNDDNSDVVLSTLYIDETNNLIIKSKTTTKENGTYELEMTYGKYAAYGLPDKIIFSFNTKDYKLPKGITFDFDDGSNNTPVNKAKAKKGRAEISFSNYTINKGLPESVFL